MKTFKIIAIISAVLFCTSCSSQSTPADTSDTQTLENTAVVRETCTVHHGDYHSIPVELAMYVGEDEVNEWITARDPEQTDDGDGCPCTQRNIKAFIDEFDIPREVFAVKADLAHYPTYDCDMLYGESADSIEEYYRNRDALTHESVKTQHLAFLEHLIASDRADEVTSLIVTDSTGAHGSTPSVPQLASALNISREELEKYISEADAMTEEACGELLRFDYDLDMIYNADGTLRELPETDGLSEHDRLLELNRRFCQREN